MFIVASHGHEREVAAVTVAVPDLRDDAELLALTQFVATRAGRYGGGGGATRLLRAVQRDDEFRVTQLLAACFTPDTRAELASTPDRGGETPLMAARSARIAEALLDAGADALAVIKGRDAFSSAVTNDRADVLGVLLEELPGNSEPSGVGSDDGSDDEDPVTRREHIDSAVDGHTLLMAARSGAIARLLLDAGASSALTVDEHGSDAFEHAASDGRTDVLRVLLEELPSDESRRERVNRRNNDGMTLLSLAPYGATWLLLLKAGADPLVPLEEGGGYGGDAIGEAFSRDDVDMMTALLAAVPSDDARGKRLNAVYGSSDDPGGTFTFLSESRDRIEMRMLLLSEGADVSPEDDHDAIDEAVDEDDADELARLLATLSSDELRDARVNRVIDGFWVNSYTGEGGQPCPLLCRARSGKVARLLLDAGADPLECEGDGYDDDAFTSAVTNDRADVLAVLLLDAARDASSHTGSDGGPDDEGCIASRKRTRVNSASWDGSTLLMAACSAAVARVLLDAGADPTAVDKQGLDALEHAVERNQASVVSELLRHLGVDAARARVCRAGGPNGSLMSRAHSHDPLTKLSASVAKEVRAAGQPPEGASAAAAGS